ncbi:PepSY-like domain-containing protein [Parabacteroides sp. PF5-9]|uniref:PepSY-like domain-containing protein n=1 Tax=Parabacteroides sp. PF5-9 TaxID=1742404 RepID=UPI002475AE2C|nr:PepSY-like domain-containing protein [Parabacteroides sp. PF5-9]MDH6356848.1 hypothetical protein [Parabacteroides sp. PF5-9]
MATKVFFKLFVLAIVTLFITSCSSDEHFESLPLTNQTASSTPSAMTPNENVLRAMDIQFPNAKSVKWTIENGYYTASFSENSSVVKAWFSQKGNWEATQTAVAYQALSQSVKRTLATSAYADYSLLSANILERTNTADIYMVKISNNTEVLNVYLSLSGDLIRTKNSTATESEAPVVIPSEVNRTINGMFNDFQVLDYWDDSLSAKVGVIDSNNVFKLVALDQNYNWISTFWVVDEEVVPVQVMNKFKASSYGHAAVSDIRVMDNGEEVSYLFYFSQNDKNKIATVKENGDCISILTY